jgi:hypothetical protein
MGDVDRMKMTDNVERNTSAGDSILMTKSARDSSEALSAIVVVVVVVVVVAVFVVDGQERKQFPNYLIKGSSYRIR